MMKTQIGLYIDGGTADDLRTRASAVGVSIGDLADLLLRFALDRMPEEALKKWAASLPSRGGPIAGRPTKNERAVIGAFGRLASKAGQDGVRRFTLNDIAAEAGLRIADAFLALKALRARDLVHGFDVEAEETDRWGRPTMSYWSLVSTIPGRALQAESGAYL